MFHHNDIYLQNIIMSHITTENLNKFKLKMPRIKGKGTVRNSVEKI